MGYEILVFLVSALVGFAAYVAGGWEPVPVERLRSLLTPRRVWILLVVTAGAVAVVASVIAVVALPGEWFYTVKGLFRSFAPHVILGLVFGLGFSIWIDQLIRPAALVGARRSTAHRLWGIALAVLFLGGIFMGPVNRLLPRLSGISTPAVSLEFAAPHGIERRFEVITSAPSGSGIADEKALARSYLGWANIYFERDSDYVRLLHGDRSFDLWRPLHGKAQRFVEPIARCFSEQMEQRNNLRDPGAIHAEFGPALAAGGAWLRLVLAADDQAKVRRQRSLLATMYSHLPQCRSRPGIRDADPLPREAYELPYFALALAHLMELAGYGHVGAQLVAQWIDRSLDRDRADRFPDWYRIRAYVHLSIMAEAGRDPLVTHELLRRNVRLFEKTLRRSPNPALRYWDRWNKICGPSERRQEIARIRFTFMSQANRWIRQAIYSDQATAELLRYAENNTATSETCYPQDLPDVDKRKADFLASHGGLLVALASSERAVDRAGDGNDLDTYRRARAYLLRAMTLLHRLHEGERVGRRDGSVEMAIDDRPLHQEVVETQRYLRRAELALNIR